MCSWTHVRCNGAFGHTLRVFPYSTVERHFDTHPNRLGYILNASQRDCALCLEAAPDGGGTPIRGNPLTIIPDSKTLASWSLL